MFYLCSWNKWGTVSSWRGQPVICLGLDLEGACEMAALKLVETDMETDKQKALAAALKQIDQAIRISLALIEI